RRPYVPLRRSGGSLARGERFLRTPGGGAAPRPCPGRGRRTENFLANSVAGQFVSMEREPMPSTHLSLNYPNESRGLTAEVRSRQVILFSDSDVWQRNIRCMTHHWSLGKFRKIRPRPFSA